MLKALFMGSILLAIGFVGGTIPVNGVSAQGTAGPPPRSSNTGLFVGIGVGAFLLVVVVVAVIVAAVLYASGAQIANVFSNVAAALGSPSP